MVIRYEVSELLQEPTKGKTPLAIDDCLVFQVTWRCKKKNTGPAEGFSSWSREVKAAIKRGSIESIKIPRSRPPHSTRLAFRIPPTL